MFFIPLAALIVVSLLYREELGPKALMIYWGVWLGGLVVAMLVGSVPGIFIAYQCVLAVVMLIHVRANPDIR